MPTPVHGEALETPFLYNNCETLGYMSPTLGMNIPCNILLRTGECWTELHDDQSTNPILYLDTCIELDKTIEDQFCTLLGHYGYNTPLSIDIPVSYEDADAGQTVQTIRQSRQCISIGSVILNDELIRVWMIRPTINYTTYVVKTSEKMRTTVANNYVVKFRSFGNYDFHEVNIECPAKEPTTIKISGTMAHYYIAKCGVVAKLQSVSMGGSLLRVHQIRDFRKSPKITDICMNISILKSLTHGKHTSMSVETGNRCVTVKCHTNRSLGAGPSLTVGENGGFQWIGSPNDISESISSIFAVMNKNMRSREFIEVISRSRSMIRYIYPSGIKRTKQCHDNDRGSKNVNKSNLRNTPLQF